MYRQRQSVTHSTKLSFTHSATHEKPKFEICKYMCNKEFFFALNCWRPSVVRS